MKQLNRFYLTYLQWVEANNFQDLGTDPLVFTSEVVKEMIKQSEFEPHDYEHQSIGNILVTFFGNYLVKCIEELKIIAEQKRIEDRSFVGEQVLFGLKANSLRT